MLNVADGNSGFSRTGTAGATNPEAFTHAAKPGIRD